MMSESEKKFSIPVRVYIEDTDAGGIVYHTNYLKFMERCRTEFLRTLGYHKAAVFADGLIFVVHSVQIDYRGAARLDDELQITSAISRLARTYIDFKQDVRRGHDSLCTGSIRVACVKRDTMKPHAIPTHMHQQLTHFIETPVY